MTNEYGFTTKQGHSFYLLVRMEMSVGRLTQYNVWRNNSFKEASRKLNGSTVNEQLWDFLTRCLFTVWFACRKYLDFFISTINYLTQWWHRGQKVILCLLHLWCHYTIKKHELSADLLCGVVNYNFSTIHDPIGLQLQRIFLLSKNL